MTKKRRATVNRTGISRVGGLEPHQAWIGFACLRCGAITTIPIGMSLLDPSAAFDGQSWKCSHCGFIHSKQSDLPFNNWDVPLRKHTHLATQRFWIGFFRIYTEDREAYWKQCTSCGKVLPFGAFSGHVKWGPLERQMECRACKGAINAVLNVLRTPEQHHESSVRRRVAELLLKGKNERLDVKALFKRFGGRCFKTGKPLKIEERQSWAIDHILPSRFLYPLTVQNAALLSKEANDKKRDQWPRDFYNNKELMELAKITGADLTLLSSKTPIPNPSIDVNACVKRYLQVRQRSNLAKRVAELCALLTGLGLVAKLSPENKKLLGLK